VVVRCLCRSVHCFVLPLSELDADGSSSRMVLASSSLGGKRSDLLLLTAPPGMASRGYASKESMRAYHLTSAGTIRVTGAEES
jgi:hypothetical protein